MHREAVGTCELDVLVNDRDDGITVRHRQGPAGKEIALYIDDEAAHR
jgi:hypothetical protein